MKSPFNNFSISETLGAPNQVYDELTGKSPFRETNESTYDSGEAETDDGEIVDEEEMEFDLHESGDFEEFTDELDGAENHFRETTYEEEGGSGNADPLPVPEKNPVPFAPIPVGTCFWPIITSHAKGREVAFQGTDKKFRGNVGRRFLASRTDGGRYHVGIDLWANHKDPIVACEDGTIVNFYHFYRSTYALLVEHRNLVINYGEVHKDSLTANNLKVGDRVQAGQVIGFAGKMYSSSMLHFETYTKGTRSNKRFQVGGNPPKEILNPTKYLLHLQSNGQGGKSSSPGRTVPASKDWSKEIAQNRSYSLKLGWDKYIYEINDLLLKVTGQSNISLGEQAFAEAVALWQLQNGFSGNDADGVVGPATWKKMQSQLGIKTTAAQAPVKTPAPAPGDNIVSRILKYTAPIELYSKMHSINPNVIRGIVAAESGGDYLSGRGGTGYKGLMQAERTTDQLEPAVSIRTGIEKFIKFRDTVLNPWLGKLGISKPFQYDENYLKACLSCYNAGPVTALKAIQYAHSAGDWSQWLSGENYLRALLFSGGYASYSACSGNASATEINRAKAERIRYRFKTSGWRSEPDPAPWNTVSSVIHPVMRCWIETKFKNTPGYLDKFIRYYRYFENNPVVHEMEDSISEASGNQDHYTAYEFDEEERPDGSMIDPEMDFTGEFEHDDTLDEMHSIDEEHIDEWLQDSENTEPFEPVNNESGEDEDGEIVDHEEWEEDSSESARTDDEWEASAEDQYDGPHEHEDGAYSHNLVSEDTFSNWQKSVADLKTRFPSEPEHNIDQLPIPGWLDHNRIYTDFIQKHGNEARTIIGDASKKVSARYFVLHDTAVAADFKQAQIKGKGIHLWVNAQSPVLSGNDWHIKGLGVKLERKRNNAFVHVEITRDKELQKAVQRKTNGKKVSSDVIINAGGIRNFGTYYTDKQYELVAYAYLVASLRRGKFLTVTIHREVDRSVVVRRPNQQYGYGHDDPQFFDIDYFYRIICRLLSFPEKMTFGIQRDRVLAQKQSNMAGYQNMFIPYVAGHVTAANQYGELIRLNPASSRYKTVKLKHGYYYDVTGLKNKFSVPEAEVSFETPLSTPLEVPRLIAEDFTLPGYSCYVRIDLGKANYPMTMTGIYIPSAFDPAKPVDVVLFLHGMTTTFPGPCAQVIDFWSASNLPKYDLRIREDINSSERNVVLVVPSMGDSPNKYRNQLSDQKQGLDSYLSKVLLSVNTYIVRKRYNSNPVNFRNVILAAHSAGGLQMLKIAIGENPIYGPKILECWGFDCLYGKVTDAWLKWASKNGNKKLMIYYQSSTEGNSILLQRNSKKLPNVFVRKSGAKNHYWVVREHLKDRVTKIGQSNPGKPDFEEPDYPM